MTVNLHLNAGDPAAPEAIRRLFRLAAAETEQAQDIELNLVWQELLRDLIAENFAAIGWFVFLAGRVAAVAAAALDNGDRDMAASLYALEQALGNAISKKT